MRMTEDDLEKLEELSEFYNLERSGVIRYAIDYLYSDVRKAKDMKEKMKNDGWF